MVDDAHEEVRRLLVSSLPRALAVLVAHDGEAWLPETLASLLAQDHPSLEILAVDNGSTDGSRELLVDALGEDRVLVAERDLGFGAAVSMAVDAADPNAEHLLFLHDDCEIGPSSARVLAEHLVADDELAIVGGKHVDWHDPSRLQSVGWSVDLTGRADSGVESDELDQGQRDQVHRALYVSTSMMLIERAVFERLGRFDRRFHLFRDDLDLCWRAWLAGHSVEVVPTAVGRHVASASNYERLGQTAFIGPRYFAERNTLATLLKNYGAARLALVLPLYFLVGFAKVLGFVATRRLSDAWQTVRAWIWNLRYLRGTLRLRSAVQQQRQRGDGELRDLFVKVAPRLRAYGEAVGEWIAGSEMAPGADAGPDPETEPTTATARLIAYVRTHPVTVAAIVLFVLGLAIAAPLMQYGTLRGGELAPWPASPRVFLADYVDSWHDVGGIGTSRSPSPAQALLGLLQALLVGSSWLASRLVILGALPLAWLLSLRAGAVLTDKRIARVSAATAYVLSPPALTALVTGRVGALVVIVALPSLVSTYASLMRPGSRPDVAWRATAAAAIVAAVAISFAPTLLIAFLLWTVVALAATAGLDTTNRNRRGVVIRVLSVALGTFLVLFPWSLTLFRPDSPVFGGISPVGADARPFIEWLLLAPELLGTPGLLAGVGFLLAGVLGIVFGWNRRPVAVAGLWIVALLGVYAAWGLGRAGADAWTWAGLPLVGTAGALSGLLAVAMATAGSQLSEHGFGWRQLAAGVTTLAVSAGLVISAGSLLDDPWGAYALAEPPLPEFIAVDRQTVGDFRVLVLADQGGEIVWDVTGPAGATMASYGVPTPRRFVDQVSDGITDVVGGADPGAAGRLGLLNIRYVVVPEVGRSAQLDGVLADQLDLEPQPVADGQVFRVAGWLPRASFLPEEAVATVSSRGEIGRGAQEAMLVRQDDTARFAGSAPRSGSIIVSEIATTGWEAVADGRPLSLTTQDALVRFDLEGPAENVVVEHAQQGRRTILVAVQVFFLLIALSLMLRPPRFAQEGVRP